MKAEIALKKFFAERKSNGFFVPKGNVLAEASGINSVTLSRMQNNNTWFTPESLAKLIVGLARLNIFVSFDDLLSFPSFKPRKDILDVDPDKNYRVVINIKSLYTYEGIEDDQAKREISELLGLSLTSIIRVEKGGGMRRDNFSLLCRLMYSELDHTSFSKFLKLQEVKEKYV